jgi:GDP-6-deoxy-D-talose 4-dehydrogenase
VKILITGINGFVGRYLKGELENGGHSVCGIDVVSNDPSVFAADICNEVQLSDVLTRTRPGVIYHLAAIANVDHKNPSKIYDVNIGGTKTLLSSMLTLDYIPKLIFISSSQVYGQVPVENLPITENHPVLPVNHYGASKAAGELLIRAFGCEYGLQYMIFRPFNHTGPGQTDNFVIPKIVNVFRNKADKVELGNIDVIRDFCDVRDVVHAYSSAVSFFESGKIYNISSGSGISIRQIVELMKDISHHDIIIEEKTFLKRSNEIEKVIGDSSRISEQLKWTNKFDIRQTLVDMFNLEAK